MRKNAPHHTRCIASPALWRRETLSEDAEDLPAEETADAPAPAPAESGAAEGAGEAEEEAREAAEGPAEREPVLGGVGQGGYAEDDEDTVDMIESSFQVCLLFLNGPCLPESK